jgi:hypothetical protein
MAAKKRKIHEQRSSPSSDSSLSDLSRSPTPPAAYTSSTPIPSEEDSAVLKPPSKRQKVTQTTSLGVRRTHRRTGRSSSVNTDWSNPKSKQWDILRVLQDDECLAEDRLLERPSRNHTYIDSKLHLKDPLKYSPLNPDKPTYPKVLYCLPKRGTSFGPDTPRNSSRNSPAILDPPPDAVVHKTHFADVFKKEPILTDFDTQEDGFHARPSIKLPIPDHLKAILVDDWENVTKNQQLVPLPSAHPVNSILADYLAFEQPKRTPGSAQADILEEVVAGLKEYFERCLGRILLYR